MNLQTSAAAKGRSIGLVTAIVDGESQSSKEVTNQHSSTDCSERYTSWLPTPGFKEWIREGKWGCNWATRYRHPTHSCCHSWVG